MSQTEVKQEIIKYITQKRLNKGDRLPPENELATNLKLSRITLRDALRQLKDDGLIYSRQGSGTFIAADVKEIFGTLSKNLSMTEMITISGFKPGVSLYEVEFIEADDELAFKLNVKSGTGVLLCKRVRTADDEAVVFSKDYLSPRTAEIFLTHHEKEFSLFKILEEENNIKIGNSFAEIYPMKCNRELADKLHYNEGEPILVLKQTVVDKEGKPLFYGEEYFRPDKFKFTINRRRS